MNLELKVTRERKATIDEVKDLIWGTGVLTWPWWGGVTDNGDATFTFRHDGKESSDGALDCTTTISARDILDAAGKQLARGIGGEDAREAIEENIGYLDAEAADVVLQHAILGSIIFG